MSAYRQVANDNETLCHNSYMHMRIVLVLQGKSLDKVRSAFDMWMTILQWMAKERPKQFPNRNYIAFNLDA